MIPGYKIAIIAGQLVVGGAERQLYLWLSHMDREMFNPVVLTLHPGFNDYWEKPIEDLGIPLYRIPHRRFRLLRLLDIINVLRLYRPQLIHGWHVFASAYAGMAAKLLRTKSLGGVRGTYRTFTEHSLEARLTLFFTDAILANSNSAASQLYEGRMRKKQRIYSVQNAVEEDFFDRREIRTTIVEKYGLSPDAVWLGSISRLDPKKNFNLLIRVIALLKEDVNHFHFIFIGDGPQRESLEKLSKDLRIEHFITFTGEIPMASTWLKALDIFCFTSEDEGLPNVVMEAAAAGLPVVSWRHAFIEELLQDQLTAMLIEPGDLVGMKNTLVKLIRSPSLRDQIGRAASHHVLESFSVKRYNKQMSSVYLELLAGQPSSARIEQ
jgi:glycosyltransferase involved in cell wall biosynthesis